MVADQSPSSALLGLPLEMRHKIFGFSSQREDGSFLILKEYLEKIDPKIQPLPPPPPPPAVAQDNSDSEDGEEEDDTGAQGTAGTATANGVTQQHENDSEEEEEEDQDEIDDDEIDSDEDDEGVNGTATATTTIRPRSTGRTTKYVHILPIIELDRCPPPVSLLQTCKQLRDEAISYHRNACTLTINVTKAFKHQSMFNETLDIMINQPFSPLEHIRKVCLEISWDSEWLREKTAGTPPASESAIFYEHYFRERIETTMKFLNAAAELRSVTINWHDTERTGDSLGFMNNILMEFFSLSQKMWIDTTATPFSSGVIEVTAHEHITEAGTAHAANSVLALRRTEFDNLLAEGNAFR